MRTKATNEYDLRATLRPYMEPADPVPHEPITEATRENLKQIVELLHKGGERHGSR